mmetsp:Transcript_72412/g.182717  ORF Transcript_72412/g.182717 Transcript_72412/m.182717 type:complete len:299 (-) Transcript_72412:8-904(-)
MRVVEALKKNSVVLIELRTSLGASSRDWQPRQRCLQQCSRISKRLPRGWGVSCGKMRKTSSASLHLPSRWHPHLRPGLLQEPLRQRVPPLRRQPRVVREMICCSWTQQRSKPTQPALHQEVRRTHPTRPPYRMEEALGVRWLHQRQPALALQEPALLLRLLRLRAQQAYLMTCLISVTSTSHPLGRRCLRRPRQRQQHRQLRRQCRRPRLAPVLVPLLPTLHQWRTRCCLRSHSPCSICQLTTSSTSPRLGVPLRLRPQLQRNRPLRTLHSTPCGIRSSTKRRTRLPNLHEQTRSTQI